MGGNWLPQNLKIPEAKLIPLLMLQTNAMKMMTPNWAAQMNLEDQVALMDQEDQVAPVVLVVSMVPEVRADPATTLPTNKMSCRNS